MNKLNLLIPVLATLFISGCSSTASFSKTGDYVQNRKSSNKCDITVYTTRPSVKFHEIGLIEFSGNFWGGRIAGASSVTDAKYKASDIVCNNGGNGLLLWEANGAGYYKKAIVIYVEK